MSNVNKLKEDTTIETRNINWFNIGSYLLLVFVGMLIILSFPENIRNSIFLNTTFLFFDVFLIIFWVSILLDVFKLKTYPMDSKITGTIFKIIGFFFIGLIFAKKFIDRNVADKSVHPQTPFEEVLFTFSVFLIVGSFFVMLFLLLGMATYKGIIFFNERWSSWETEETNKEIIKLFFVLIIVVLFLLELILSAFFGQGYFFGDIYHFSNSNPYLDLICVTGFGVCIWAIVWLFKDIFFTLPTKLAKEN